MRDDCPLCTGKAAFSFRKGDFIYKRCGSCGTLFVANLLEPEQIHSFYSENYFEASSSISEATRERRGYPSYQEAEESLKNSFRYKLSLIRQFVSRGKLLEVGAAYGMFMTEANQYFICTGLDVSHFAVKVAQEKYGLDVRQGSIEDGVPFEVNSFDVVVMWDVIEHLIEPMEGLGEAFRVLKPGGYLFFSTDDAGNWLPRLLGSNWWALAAPLHLCHFTKKGTAAVLKRAGAFQDTQFVPDKRVYGIGEIVSHFGVSYKNRALLNLGEWLDQTALGSKLITVNRPEQFVAYACKT